MNNKKILKSLLIAVLAIGFITPNVLNANENEVAENDKEEITTFATNVDDAPLDWAFKESSIPLHDAFITAHPAVDTSGDGYISKSEAAAWPWQITLNWKKLTGTIDGIQYFTNTEYIYLNGNQLSGEIPAAVYTMSKLKRLDLSTNQFEGTIPNEIDQLTNIEVLNLYSNQLSGSLPSTIGNLTKLKELRISTNKLTGTIPAELGSMNTLEVLALNVNQFTGELPDFSGLTNIVHLDFHNNLLDINAIAVPSGKTQEDLYNSITQEQIDKALSEYSKLADNTAGDTKIKIDGLLENAQILVDVKTAVEGLFTDETHVSINETTNQAAIDDAQELVSNLTDEELKEKLQIEIDKAQELLNQRDAENAVDDLFDEDGKIKDSVTQEDIDDTQDLVDKVTDDEKKQELQDKLDEAQKQLDEREFVVLEGFKTFTGTGDVSAKIDAPIEKFSKVYVDGVELNTANYSVKSGSVVITLNETYLKTLANGTYNVEVEFSSGAKIKTTLTVDVKTITDPTNPVDPVDPTEPVDPTNPVEPTDPTSPTEPSDPSVDVPTVSKPSVDPNRTTTVQQSTVNTGDNTNIQFYIGLLAATMTLLGFMVYKRKKVK